MTGPALPLLRRALDAIRVADWMTPDRVAAYLRVLLILTAVLAAVDIGYALAHGGWDFSGKTLGTDFLCFWAAAKLALAGQTAELYVPAVQHAAEQASFGGLDPGYYAFIYPPVTLLLCLPLGLMPYLAALAVWVLGTGAAYVAVVWTILRRERGLLLPVLAFPAVLVTAGHGQNAFLTTALFGGGLLLLDRRPALAGLCLGLLVVKPHLGLMIPLFLLARDDGRAFAAAAVTVLLAVAASCLAFGTDLWVAYLHASALVRMTLEQGLVEPEKLQSAFAAVRLWGGPLWLAYTAQALSALLAGAFLVDLARRRPDGRAGGAVLVTAALLTTPYVLDYDLTLLALPLAWLFVEARRTGFRDWEKTIAAAAFALPLVSRLVATNTGVPLGPLVIGALFWIVWRRANASTARQSAWASSTMGWSGRGVAQPS